jgi:hypothetical protein
MSNFDSNKWFKNQYLTEAGLTESVAGQAAKAIDAAIESVDESLSYKDFAIAVATILKDEYGSQNFNPFMEVLHAELGMNESLNEETKYDTYKVHIVTSDPREGGPDEWFDEEVKVDSSLTGDDIKASIKDTIYDMGYRRLYKLNYEKA